MKNGFTATIARLPELREVDVSAIERELRSESGSNSTCSLIYAVWDFDDGGESIHLVRRLAQENSARAILLRVNNKADSPPRAWVAADRGDVELLVLEVNGDSAAAALLSRISLSGSRILIWDNSLSYTHPLLRELGAAMDRVIVSVIPPCSEMNAWKTFLSVCDALGSRPVVTDLAESLLASWQAHISQSFASDPQRAAQIQVIRLSGEESKPSAEFLFLAAWISCILQWNPAGIERAGERFLLHFTGKKQIVLEPNTERANRIEFLLSLPDGEQTIHCNEPESEIRVAELLLMQLKIRERDSVRDESLRRVRLWL